MTRPVPGLGPGWRDRLPVGNQARSCLAEEGPFTGDAHCGAATEPSPGIHASAPTGVLAIVVEHDPSDAQRYCKMGLARLRAGTTEAS
jgi:hypothetical protein